LFVSWQLHRTFGATFFKKSGITFILPRELLQTNALRMESKIAIYENHEDAVKALLELSKHSFPMKHVSLLGNSKVIDNHVHVISLNWIKELPVLLGIAATTAIGILTGMDVINWPGLHVLYGAGAFVGAIAGFYAGLVLGGVGWIIVSLIIKRDRIVKLRERLKYGSFYVMVNGSSDEIERAEQILHTEGSHLEIV